MSKNPCLRYLPPDSYICRCFPGPDAKDTHKDGKYDNETVLAVLEEAVAKRKPQPMPPSGPELAAMMKIGTRVVRGVDWKWGDQVN